MLNFKNISPTPDFYSKLDLLSVKLDIVNKNILYVTHECDKIKKLIEKVQVDKDLQKQVDEYFEDETSPQTDTETKED